MWNNLFNHPFHYFTRTELQFLTVVYGTPTYQFGDIAFKMQNYCQSNLK